MVKFDQEKENKPLKSAEEEITPAQVLETAQKMQTDIDIASSKAIEDLGLENPDLVSQVRREAAASKRDIKEIVLYPIQ